jgi:hypothetical protein
MGSRVSGVTKIKGQKTTPKATNTIVPTSRCLNNGST